MYNTEKKRPVKANNTRCNYKQTTHLPTHHQQPTLPAVHRHAAHGSTLSTLSSQLPLSYLFHARTFRCSFAHFALLLLVLCLCPPVFGPPGACTAACLPPSTAISTCST